MTTFTVSPSLGLRQLDADAGDDAVQRVLHHVRVRVADDHVALAEIVGRRGLTGLRQPRLDDQVPDLPLYGAESVDGPYATAAHAAQVGGAGGEPSLRRVEAAVDDQLRPGAVEIEVVRVAMHRCQLCPGWAGRHLGDGNGAVGAAEPLHVRQRVPHPQRLESGRTPVVDA